MKQSFITIGCLIFGLLVSASTAQADLAVLVQITHQSVSLERAERVDQSKAQTTTETQTQTESDATQRLVQGVMTKKLAEPEDDSKLLVRWYNALGELIHHEVLRDPRYIHAPGSPEMVLPEATQLLRAPNSAVLLRVKPRGFAEFIDFNV